MEGQIDIFSVFFSFHLWSLYISFYIGCLQKRLVGSRDGRTFFQLGGLTSDLKWGGGGGDMRAAETLILVSFCFLVKLGGGVKALPAPLPPSGSAVPG